MLSIKPGKYSNYEIKLHNYFYNKTQIDPRYIILIKIEEIDFIFFFVRQNQYFQARSYLNSIRHNIKNKKVLIIGMDRTLIKLLFNLFPDIYIDDIKIERSNKGENYEVYICFLNKLNDYHIAVGERGCYIKAVNELMRKHITFDDVNDDDDRTPLTIKCSKSF
jgi:hypothetical protein